MFKFNNSIMPNKVRIGWHFSSNKYAYTIGTLIRQSRIYDTKRIFIGRLTTEQPISVRDICSAARRAHGNFLNALLFLLVENE